MLLCEEIKKREEELSRLREQIEIYKEDKKGLLYAKQISLVSDDPFTQVGCSVLIRKPYSWYAEANKLPEKLKHKTDWLQNRELKNKIILHAEKVLLNKELIDFTDCTIYTYPFIPCSQCMATLIERGFVRVVSLIHKRNETMPETFWMAREAGIELKLYDEKEIFYDI
jgi:dCMP deaminase